MLTRVAVPFALALVLALPALVGVSQAAPTAPLWPGHQPGKVVLGMSCGSVCAEREREVGRPYGVHRQFRKWGDWAGVVKQMRADHSAGRLPWISVEGPESGSPSGWRALTSGKYDAQIRALAASLKANSARPTILTFHHEPSNDGTEAEGKDWASANNRVFDVLNQAGGLSNVAFAPILGDWLFNPTNRGQDPANWVSAEVLRRAAFLGIDVYENPSGETLAQRLPRIIGWMADQGFPNKMVGVGEMGATDAAYSAKSAVQWVNESLTWAATNPDKIGVISYFNSTANSRSGVYWPLNESTAKLAAYRGWLGHPQFAG